MLSIDRCQVDEAPPDGVVGVSWCPRFASIDEGAILLIIFGKICALAQSLSARLQEKATKYRDTLVRDSYFTQFQPTQ